MLAVTKADMQSAGRAIRTRVSLKDHAELRPVDRDVVRILSEQNASRLQDLVPVRMGRMLQSPFSYYRGTAAVMALDLSTDTNIGLHVVSCGDAHISNFGLYASPERRLLFDLNDFDEAGMAPWEWDVKRLAASIVIGGRDAGYSADETKSATRSALRRYRELMTSFTELSAIDRHFFHVDTESLESLADDSDSRKLISRTIKKAKKRTSDQVLERMTTVTSSGTLAIIDQPPVTQHVDHGDSTDLNAVFEQYRSTLRADVNQLLSQFRLADYVLRVVGVGSVGTRCYVILFVGPSGEPLFLQAKEAGPSVLQTHGGVKQMLPDGLPPAPRGDHGYRVVSSQRILQGHSDPFLGWIEGYRGEDGSTGARTDYYWRQFRDMKGSVDLEGLTASQFEIYVRACASLLARAHSQSPAGMAVAAYLDGSEDFEKSFTRWANRYADQTERDFERLETAARSGEIPVERDV